MINSTAQGSILEVYEHDKNLIRPGNKKNVQMWLGFINLKYS